jgi:DHA1 family L-arabinose/isopropyl-beta-D-thiogalactopyranoside export protein-like MFS transporter/DHA1 family inner membrane transport protein
MNAVSTRRATGALVALSVAAFCYVTVEVLPIGLLTVIAADLHKSRSQTGLLVTGYAIVVIIASIPLARATRRVPRRLVFGVTLGVLVLATLASVAAHSYAVLFAARLVTALTQAMFWSVVASTASGMFPAEVRGRVVSRLSIGNSLAPVLGVPAGTWLGEALGWRAAFLVVAGVAFVTLVAVLVFVPTFAPSEGTAAVGSAPDARRFRIIVIVTAVVVTGLLTAFTYMTPFFLDVSGFTAGSLGPLLFVSGIAGVAGAFIVGATFDRRPWETMIVPIVLIAFGLLGLYLTGGVKLTAVLFVGFASLGFGALPPALQARTLQVAPGSTDMASAAISSAFNIGIAGGSFIGGLLVADVGTRSVALAGAVLATAALAIMLSDRRTAGRAAVTATRGALPTW